MPLVLENSNVLQACILTDMNSKWPETLITNYGGKWAIIITKVCNLHSKLQVGLVIHVFKGTVYTVKEAGAFTPVLFI